MKQTVSERRCHSQSKVTMLTAALDQLTVGSNCSVVDTDAFVVWVPIMLTQWCTADAVTTVIYSLCPPT